MIPYAILPQLAEALSGIYRTLDLATTMATTAGLEVWKIPLGSTTFTAWVAILEEAEHQQRTAVILRRAQDDYPADTALAAACQAYAAWVTAGRPAVGFPGRDTAAGTTFGPNGIVILSGFSTTQLQQIRQTLGQSLPSGQAILRVDPASERLLIQAPGTPAIVLSKEAAKALLGMTSTANEYLTALRIHPDYGRWTSQFVPLAGTMPLAPHPPGWSDLPPEFTLVESRGEGASRELRRIALKDITEAVAQHPAFALTGAPGAGKTTTLYKVALDAAAQRQETGQGRLPLYLPLSEYRDYLSPYDFVKARFEQRLGQENLGDHLRHGGLLLLLDALNEMPAADQRDYGLRVGAWRRFIDDWPGNQVIVSCRSRDYTEKLGVPEVEIDPLDDARVQDFLHKYLPQGDLAARTWQRLEGTTLLSLVGNPYYLRMLVHIVGQGGQWPATVAGLFGAFIRILLKREELRHHRGWPGIPPMQEALKQVAEKLQPSGTGTRLPRPEFVALVPAQVDSPNGSLTLAAPDIVDLSIAATLLDAEERPNDVEQVRFYHHLLQEYFAALALVDRFRRGENLAARWQAPRLVDEMPDPGPLGDYEPLPPPPTTRWEEPTILAAGLVPDLAEFVAAVQRANPALAARCLTESGLAPPSSLRAEAQQRLLAELANPAVHLRARLAAGEALGRLGDPRFREVNVDGQRVLIPPLVRIPGGKWHMGSTPAEIDELAAAGFPANDEGPRHPVTLAAYWIGQYPVTNGEWACFMQAGGYQDLAHWETAEAQAWLRGEEASGPIGEWLEIWRVIRQDPTIMQRQGWTSRDIDAWSGLIQLNEDEFRAWLEQNFGDRHRDQPHYWDDARFNNPSQPVVGITWYEARAYCQWLDGVLRRAQEQGKVAAETLPEGYSVRLPTEAQWERAARGPQGWKYPWGNGWDTGKANTFEGHVLRTNAMGVYAGGVSAEGIHDLGGNVWEWTLSQYQEYPIRANDGRNDPAGDSRRVVRGGSWHYDQRVVRAASRGRHAPGSFDNYVGLRVVVSLSSGF